MRKLFFLVVLLLCHPAAAATWYVHSATGSDSNNGTSAATPFQTLTAAQSVLGNGDTVVILDTATYRQQATAQNTLTTAATIGTRTATAQTTIDGSNGLSGTWTQGTGNVWYLSYAAPPGYNAVEFPYSRVLCQCAGQGLYDVLAQNTSYTSAQAQAQVALIPGSFYWDNAANIIYVQTPTSGNPNSDGNTYTATYRQWAFQGQSLTDVDCTCAGDEHTASVGGPVTRCVFEQTPDHACYTGVSSAFTDCFFINMSGNALVTYAGSLTGVTLTLNRCDFDAALGCWVAPGNPNLSSASYYNANEALYAHSAAPQTSMDSLSVDQCAFRNWATTGNPQINALTVTNSYFDTYGSPIQGVACGTPGIFSYTRILGKRRVGIDGILTAGVNGATWNLTDCAFHDNTGYTILDMKHSITTVTANLQGVALWCDTAGGYLINLPGGTVTMQKCILGGSANITDAGFTAGTTITSDYNVFACVSGASYVNVNEGGTGYSSLSAWNAASGQDAHSVVLHGADQTAGTLGSPSHAFWYGVAYGIDSGPASGDFRVNPSAYLYDINATQRTGLFGDGTTAITAAGPQTHWDWGVHAVKSGPPSAWPDAFLPSTRAQMMTALFKQTPQAPIAIHK
jgi:hypothetical protein